jgi:hypothetical protein
MTAAMHSFPGIASLWLHLRLSNDFARSVAGCCDLPWRYSSWMQHWVITDEPLGQMDEMRSLSARGVRVGNCCSLNFTDPTSTDSSRVRRSIFCDIAVPHISESTDDGRVRRKEEGLTGCLKDDARTENLVRLPETKRVGIHGHQFTICF